MKFKINKTSISFWKSLSIWTRFSILSSDHSLSSFPFTEMMRFISLLQVLLMVIENVRTRASQQQVNFFSLLKDILTAPIQFSLNPWTALTLVASYFFIICLIIILSIYSITKGYEKNDHKYLKPFSLWTTFHAEVLFYPLNLCLLNLIKNANESQNSLNQKILTVSLSSVLLLLNVILAFYKIMFCYSRLRFKKLISRKESLHLTGIATLKLFLPLFQFLTSYEKGVSNYEIASVIISLLVFIGLLVYILAVLPEYTSVLLKMHIIFLSMGVSVCLSQLSYLVFGNQNTFVNIGFFAMPFWVKLNLNAYNYFIKRLKHCPDKVSNVNHSIHLEIFYKDLKNLLNTDMRTINGFLSISQAKWLSDHIFPDSAKQIPMDNSKSMEFERRSKIYLKGFLEKLLVLHPRNTLGLLTYAKLIINNFSLYSKGYYLCGLVSRQSTSTPDKISVFYLIDKIEKNLDKAIDKNDLAVSKCSKLLWQGFKYDIQFQDLKSQLDKYIEQSISFWQTLQESKPNILNLFLRAKGLEEKHFAIEDAWKRFELDFPTGASAIHLLYGVFNAQFMNMPHRGALYIEKYSAYVKHKNLFTQNKDRTRQDEYGTIMISGGKKSLGEIIYCSEMIFEMFGIEKKTLVGKNISTIMPRFFQQKHHQFLANQYELGENNLIGRESFLYGKDSNHNVFPISLMVGIHLDVEKGIVYTGLIRNNKQIGECILFREDGMIEETSLTIRQLTGVEPYKKVDINSICPNIDFAAYQDGSEEEITSIGIKKLSSMKRKGMSPADTDSEEMFNFKLRTKRYLHFGELLNVMLLEPEGNTRERIKDIISLEKPRKKEKRIIDDTSSDEQLEIPSSKANKVKRIQIYSKENKNTEHLTTGKMPNDRNAILLSSSDGSFLPSHLNGLKVKKDPVNNSKANLRTSPRIQDKVIDDLQEIFSKPLPNRFKNAIISLFIIILITFLSMVNVQYVVLTESIQDISFAINSIRTSYDRLTSLNLIWWYGNSYQLRRNGYIPTNESDLNRFKLRIRLKRDDMKVLNDQLMKILSASKEEQDKFFFEKDIAFIYDNIPGSLGQMKVNGYEAIDILVDKLSKFDAIPNQELIQNGNPHLDFVIRNIMNDLLVSSESLAQFIQNIFDQKIDNKQFQMSAIFLLNILIGLIAISLALLIFYVNNRSDRMLIKALIGIHPQNINLIILKLMLYSNLLKKKESLLPQGLYKIHLDFSLSKDDFKHYQLNIPEYNIKGVLVTKLKRSFSLILLICCILGVSSLRHISSSSRLEEVVLTNQQIIFASKVRHVSTLSYATLIELLASLNQSMTRNQPIDKQLLYNINQIPLSNTVFEEFTDSNGQTMDPNIETILKGKPCSYVINFPGSLNDVNCPKVTQNETIGILAVYSHLREDLYTIALKSLGNLTIENSINTIIYIAQETTPKVNTINGALVFIIDFLGQKLNNQISGLLDDARSKLIIQIIMIVILSLVIVWYLFKIIFDDSMTRALLKIIPFEEITKNKPLKNQISKLCAKKIEVFQFEA